MAHNIAYALCRRTPFLLLPGSETQEQYDDAIKNVELSDGVVVTDIQSIAPNDTYTLYLHCWNHRQKKWYAASQNLDDPDTDYVIQEYGWDIDGARFSTGTMMISLRDFVEGKHPYNDPEFLPCTLDYTYEVTGRRPAFGKAFGGKRKKKQESSDSDSDSSSDDEPGPPPPRHCSRKPRPGSAIDITADEADTAMRHASSDKGFELVRSKLKAVMEELQVELPSSELEECRLEEARLTQQIDDMTTKLKNLCQNTNSIESSVSDFSKALVDSVPAPFSVHNTTELASVLLSDPIALKIVMDYFELCVRSPFSIIGVVHPWNKLNSLSFIKPAANVFSVFRPSYVCSTTNAYFPIPGDYTMPEYFMGGKAWKCGNGEYYLWRRTGENYHNGPFGRAYYYTTSFELCLDDVVTTYHLDRVFVGNTVDGGTRSIQHHLSPGEHSFHSSIAQDLLAVPQKHMTSPYITIEVKV